MERSMNRARSRAAYRQVVNDLTGDTPIETIARLRMALEGFTGYPRRPSDASGNAGAWLPAFSLAAMAQVLKSAQRQVEAGST